MYHIIVRSWSTSVTLPWTYQISYPRETTWAVSTSYTITNKLFWDDNQDLSLFVSLELFFRGFPLCWFSAMLWRFNNRCISYSIFHHLIMILCNSNQDHGESPPLEIFSLLPFSNSHHSHNHQYSMNKYVLNEFTTYLMCTTLMQTYSTHWRARDSFFDAFKSIEEIQALT